MTQDEASLPRKYFVQVEYWDCGSVLPHNHKSPDAAMECMRKGEASKRHKEQRSHGLILGIEMIRLIANGATIASVSEMYEVDKSRVRERMDNVIWLMRNKRLFPDNCHGDVLSIRENKDAVLVALDAFEAIVAAWIETQPKAKSDDA